MVRKILKSIYVIFLVGCIVALFFPEGCLFREIAIFSLVGISIINSIYDWFHSSES